MRYLQSFNNSNDIQSALDNIELGKPYVAFDASGSCLDWNTKEAQGSGYFCLEIVSAGTIILFSPAGQLENYVQYRVNGGSWTTAQFLGGDGNEIGSFNVGDKIEFKGENDYYGFLHNSQLTGNNFSNGTAYFKASGNIMSLIYGDEYDGKDYFPANTSSNFQSMFLESRLTDASELIMPATALTENCYCSMFYLCEYLTAAPALPATVLAEGCYLFMFTLCVRLTTAPDLLAPNLTYNQCYEMMFQGCGNLNSVKCLATNLDWNNNSRNWLSEVSETGTFTKAAGINWEEGASGIPTGWTVVEE